MWTAIKAFLGGLKTYAYLACGGAFALLLGYAEYEKHERKVAEDAIVVGQAKQQTVNAQQQVQHLETKNEVQTEIQKMPDPGPAPVEVAHAPAGSAAGELRDAWSRS